MNTIKSDCRYLVGIDIGDGETTASYIDLEEKMHPVHPLRIKNMNDGGDSVKIESCIYKDYEGNWDFATEPEHFYTGTAQANFKERIDVLNAKINSPDEKAARKKEAFSEFIKLVFDRIRRNNTFLRYNPETGEKNFFLVAACPSRWGKDEFTGISDVASINAYQCFLQERMPVDGIIKESDAAFFHFLYEKEFTNDQDRYLVIDYGSSTIDFTFYDLSNGRRAIDCDGTPGRECGASKVEQCILDYIEQNDPDYRKAAETIRSWLKKYDDHIEWESALLHEIKKQKETYYGNHRRKIGRLRVELRDIYEPSNENTSGLYFFNNIELSQDCIEDICLREYKEQVVREISRVAKKWNPDHIMITGGASRMPWVKPMVESVFPGVKVDTDDKTPSYVVANGIVKYLLQYKKFLERFQSIVDGFLSGYYVSKEYIMPIYNEAVTKAITPIVSQQVSLVCDHYEKNDLNPQHGTSYAALANMIDQCGHAFFSKLSKQQIAGINNIINTEVKKHILPAIERSIRDVFKESFSMTLDVPLSLDFQNSIGNQTDLTLNGMEIVKTHKPFFDLMNAERVHSERREIAQKVKKDYESQTYYFEGSDVELILSGVQLSVKQCFESAREQIPFTIY